MPAKIGDSYVSEAAYNYAKAQADADNKESGVLNKLAEKFPGLKFSVGTTPFSGAGTNNVSISPKILQQMEKDPDKRLEYEALIYDIANTDLTAGTAVKPRSAGFIIGDDGGLRAWSISGGNEKTQNFAKRSSEKNWWRELLAKKPAKKTSPPEETKAKLLKNAKKKTADEKQTAATVNISAAAKENLKQSQKTAATNSFADADELSDYLWQNFSVVKGGMAKISAKYLRACVKDEDKMQSLFDTLAAADETLKKREGEVGFQGLTVTIDENGEASLESSKSTVGINEEKSRRQIEAAATKGDMRAVITLLEKDLQEVEDGLKKNMCDEAEVEKAKKLIELAKQKLSQLPDRAPTAAEQTAMSVNLLI